jgi:hypothetical protein
LLLVVFLLIIGAVALPVLASLAFLAYATYMPGRSRPGPLLPPTAEQRSTGKALQSHVRFLSETIGERNWGHYEGLEETRRYIAGELRGMGYEVELLPYEFRRETFYNIEALLPGSASPQRSIVIGAHYDTVAGSPGANDNASGVAVLLELARELRGERFASAVRFVAFVNEEPPFFNTGEGMGSVEYVRTLPERSIEVTSMICLETLGYYSEEPGSQKYPPPLGLFYPSRGDFIAFVANFPSRRLVHRAISAFRTEAALPSEGVSIFGAVPGVSWSDHRSFWQAAIPAFMVTDTAPFRDPEYHTVRDLPDRLDYQKMARLVTGLKAVVASLAK